MSDFTTWSKSDPTYQNAVAHLQSHFHMSLEDIEDAQQLANFDEAINSGKLFCDSIQNTEGYRAKVKALANAPLKRKTFTELAASLDKSVSHSQSRQSELTATRSTVIRSPSMVQVIKALPTNREANLALIAAVIQVFKGAAERRRRVRTGIRMVDRVAQRRLNRSMFHIAETFTVTVGKQTKEVRVLPFHTKLIQEQPRLVFKLKERSDKLYVIEELSSVESSKIKDIA